MNRYHVSEHLTAVTLLLLALLAPACAPAPIADNTTLALQAGQTARTLAYPEVVAVSNGVAIHARPIVYGNGSGVAGWGVQCASGNCGAVPGSFLTSAALAQWFNALAADGWQIVTRASALVRVPLAVPLTPELLDGLPEARPQS
jgi:hypothetical protein